MEFNSVLVSETCQVYDRAKALKDFDDTKAGVKGLVDAGITTLPQIFLIPPEELCHDNSGDSVYPPEFQVPNVDLKAIHSDPMQRNRVVKDIRHACDTWGFFQVTNHGIAQDTLDQMIEGVRKFHEEPSEVKAEFYTRDRLKKVRLNSNFDLYHSKAASWRDTLFCAMAPNPPHPQEIPTSCRDIMLRYTDEVKKLGKSLFQLVSEALGLEPNYLEDIDCAKGQSLVCQYYPPCPEPDRTIGHAKHTDPDFLTVLLQDTIGGLQVLHQNRWVDVSPIRGALVINVGDLLQLVSNDMFKSVEHRVVANSVGPRVSVACFFTTQIQGSNKVYGPIKELLTEDRPAVFKETSTSDFIKSFHLIPLGVSALDLLRL